MALDYVGFGYAIIVATGGAIGYIKAGSTSSLIAGLVFGILSGVGAYLYSQNPRSYGLLLASSILLSGVMGYRFLNSGKFMPAGLVAVLSVANIIRLAYQIQNS